MNKLKFDRLINLKLQNRESIKVPKGELWRGSVYGIKSTDSLNVNEVSMRESNNSLNCVEEAVLRWSGSSGATIQGIAFKVVENV